jgi:hypothetical protein
MAREFTVELRIRHEDLVKSHAAVMARQSERKRLHFEKVSHAAPLAV